MLWLGYPENIEALLWCTDFVWILFKRVTGWIFCVLVGKFENKVFKKIKINSFMCIHFILDRCRRGKSRLIKGPNAVPVSAKKSFQMFQKGLMHYNKSI